MRRTGKTLTNLKNIDLSFWIFQTATLFIDRFLNFTYCDSFSSMQVFVIDILNIEKKSSAGKQRIELTAREQVSF